MNTRLKFLFINYLDQRKVSHNSGFAISMDLMMGLVILVVGTTMIIRVQSEPSQVVSSVTSSKALAIAETGATQYANFLNNNRGLIFLVWLYSEFLNL